MMDSKRVGPSRPWPIWLGAGMLAVAGGLAIARHFGGALAHLQTGSHARTVYAAGLIYAYGAVPTAVLAVGVAACLGWRSVAGRRTPAGDAGALRAFAMSCLALAWIGWSALPRVFVGYEHVARATGAGAEYQLGVRTALDGDDFFVVSACPGGRAACEAYGIAPVAWDEKGQWSRIRLEIDRDGALTIRTPARTTPVSLPR